MAKSGRKRTVQGSLVDAARTSVEGVRILAESAASTAAKAATGAVLEAVKGARRLVAVPKPRRKRKSKPAGQKAGRRARRRPAGRKSVRRATARKPVRRKRPRRSR
jgi:hypothetical protein